MILRVSILSPKMANLFSEAGIHIPSQFHVGFGFLQNLGRCSKGRGLLEPDILVGIQISGGFRMGSHKPVYQIGFFSMVSRSTIIPALMEPMASP